MQTLPSITTQCPAPDAAPVADILAALAAGPRTMDVADVAELLGVARSSLYEAIKAGTSPVALIHVGSRVKVLTWSVIALLTPGTPDPVRSGETDSRPCRPEAMREGSTTSAVKCE